MENKIIRVLHVFNTMGNGGIEHFVMDRYRLIDRAKIQFDFLILYNTKGYFDEEIKLLGGKIYYVGPLNKNPIKTYYQIKKVVKDNNYNIVHRHTGNAIAYFDLRAAKAGGAKKLIIHSHNNSAGKPLIHKLARAFLSFPCIRFACSNNAGKWMFGNKKFEVIKNGIDLNKYAFNKDSRDKIRKQYGIKEGTFVIGHIGRMDYQKNHSFLLDIFNEYIKLNSNSKLMCVGDGFLKDQIINKAKELGILDNIIFTGSVNNVNEIINAFDVFCLPSNYEGFGIVLVEAQGNGLKCYTSSSVVTNDCNITNNITYIQLKNNPNDWATKIYLSDNNRDFENINILSKLEYDLLSCSVKLSNYYLGANNE